MRNVSGTWATVALFVVLSGTPSVGMAGGLDQRLPNVKVRATDLDLGGYEFPATFVGMVEKMVGTGVLDLKGKRFVAFQKPKDPRMNFNPGQGARTYYGWVVSEEHGENVVLSIDGKFLLADTILGPGDLSKAIDEPPDPDYSSGFSNEQVAGAQAAMLLAAGRPDLAAHSLLSSGDYMGPATGMVQRLEFSTVLGAQSAYGLGKFYAAETIAKKMRLIEAVVDDSPDYKSQNLDTLQSLAPRRGTMVFGGGFNPNLYGGVLPAYDMWTLEQEAKRRQKTKPSDLNAISKMPEDRMVSALVTALQDVEFRTNGDRDPIMEAIRLRGDVMVPALIDEMAGKMRISRDLDYIGYGNYFGQNPFMLQTTNSMAYRALSSIWVGQPYSGTAWQPSPEMLRVLAPVLKEAWARQKTMSVPQRYADNLANPAIKTVWTKASMRSLYLPKIGEESRGRRLADDLTKGEQDTLTSAVMKRANGILGSGDRNDLTSGAELLVLGCRSGRPEYVAEMKSICEDTSRRIRGMYASSYSGYGYLSNNADALGGLVSQLVALGDKQVFSDFVNLVLEKPKDWVGSVQVLKPAWDNPDNEMVQEGTTKMVEAMTKDWDRKTLDGIVQSLRYRKKILDVPAIRALVLKALDDKSEYGTLFVTHDSPGYVQIREFAGDNSMSGSSEVKDTKFREGRFSETAWEHWLFVLTMNNQDNVFSLAWTDEAREAARQTMIGHLKDPKYVFADKDQGQSEADWPVYHPEAK